MPRSNVTLTLLYGFVFYSRMLNFKDMVKSLDVYAIGKTYSDIICFA